VCVCVREREIESRDTGLDDMVVHQNVCVCACVCVCARASARARERVSVSTRALQCASF